MHVPPKRDMHVRIIDDWFATNRPRATGTYTHAKLAILDTHNFQPLYMINKSGLIITEINNNKKTPSLSGPTFLFDNDDITRDHYLQVKKLGYWRN